jgi:transposase-like protein
LHPFPHQLATADITHEHPINQTLFLLKRKYLADWPRMPDPPLKGCEKMTPQRKAAVLAAVRTGALTVEEACRLYEISRAEFQAWHRQVGREQAW